MHKIGILFLNGGSASTAILPTEIFAGTGTVWNALRGDDAEERFEVTTASLDGEPVRVGPAIGLTPECAFDGLGDADLIFVPAGGMELADLIREGYCIDSVVAANREVVPWLRRWNAEGKQIAGVCSGVALLAAAGLLDGRRATTHWAVAERYRRRFPAVDWQPEYLVTDAGDVYCGGGINAAADLALYLVEKFCGREVAVKTAKSLLIEMPRTWQVAFAHLSVRCEHEDAPVRRAQEWLHAHYADDVRLEGLAAMVGMSGRNFARRFKQATGQSPLGYLHALRIATARRMLENGRRTVQEVMYECGYEDPIFFRKLFRRHTGLSPNEYRARFGQGRGALAMAAE
ncbi:MAG TPA: helix-turn-helix domain-containing protein [Chromatiales bacterium]|nr:helix-turn-helix domain-containing protein [Chromatiales bacterium]